MKRNWIFFSHEIQFKIFSHKIENFILWHKKTFFLGKVSLRVGIKAARRLRWNFSILGPNFPANMKFVRNILSLLQLAVKFLVAVKLLLSLVYLFISLHFHINHKFHQHISYILSSPGAFLRRNFFAQTSLDIAATAHQCETICPSCRKQNREFSSFLLRIYSNEIFCMCEMSRQGFANFSRWVAKL